jgi:hypothetical protein
VQHLDRVSHYPVAHGEEVVPHLGPFEVEDGDDVEEAASHEEVVAEEVDLALALSDVSQLVLLELLVHVRVLVLRLIIISCFRDDVMRQIHDHVAHAKLRLKPGILIVV